MRMIVSLIALLFIAAPVWAMETEKHEQGESKIHWHGYGEVHYEMPSGEVARMDAHRMVWGLSYDFSDKISLHTEVDFEHAAQEMELEYAYVDILINPAFNVRAGGVLMPVGPLNEFHEPTLFYSVERPNVEKFIIPTTWNEGGIGIFGSPAEGLKYRVYLVSGLDAGKFSDTDGIRGGRGKISGGSGSVASKPPKTGDELAFVGRVEYAPLAGLDLGLSLYQGGANQSKNTALGDAAVGIVTTDVRLRKAGLDLRAVYVKTKIDDADKVSAVTTKTIGEEISGMYLEAAYKIGSFVPFVRIEQFNTQDKVTAGKTADPKNDRDVLSLGLAYYPHPDIAFKVDSHKEENGKNEVSTQTNMGVAYMF